MKRLQHLFNIFSYLFHAVGGFITLYHTPCWSMRNFVKFHLMLGFLS